LHHWQIAECAESQVRFGLAPSFTCVRAEKWAQSREAAVNRMRREFLGFLADSPAHPLDGADGIRILWSNCSAHETQ
jgi:hypothetical protein